MIQAPAAWRTTKPWQSACARSSDMTGRPMKGCPPEGVAEERDLAAWVARGVDFARSLPPKG